MKWNVFSCEIIDEAGNSVKLGIAEPHEAYMDFLNMLCGAVPVDWIDNTSHNKIILCDKDFKDNIKALCDKHFTALPDLSLFNDFISGQTDDSYLAFLRNSVLLNYDKKERRGRAMFMLKRRRVLDCYDTNVFGDKKDVEQFTGPNDLRTCVCRFCNKPWPQAKFKKKNAHAIPQSIGNNLVFCNDECKDCNDKLSIVDKEIGEYLKYRRSDYKILNKKNKVIHVTGHNFDYDGPTGDLKISKCAILAEQDDMYYVKLEGADPITHLGIYKSLAKIAIDLMPRECVDEFQATVRWIKGEFTPNVVPDVVFAYRAKKVIQPIAKVYIRKDDARLGGLPRCIVRLDVMDLAFFYIVPLAADECDLKSDALLPFVSYLITKKDLKTQDGKVGLERINMADRIGKFAHVKEWVKKSDCQIVDQSVFVVQEKNPNAFDFPDFDASKVSVISNRVIRADVVANRSVADAVRIADVSINPVKVEIRPAAFGKNPIFEVEWSISVVKIDGWQDVFAAEGLIRCSHSKAEDVIYMDGENGETSSHLMEYLLDEAFKLLGSQLKEKLPKFEFDQLAAFVMESIGHVMHFDENAEQSVVKKL